MDRTLGLLSMLANNGKSFKKQKHLFVLLLAMLMAAVPNHADAARKYYPPGVNPINEQPEQAPVNTPPIEPVRPEVTGVQSQPIVKQVVKTVTVSEPVKPRDPLSILLDDHRFYDALRLVEARLEKSPKNTSLLLLRGQLLREEHRYTDSIEQYTAIVVKSHDNKVRANAWNGLGWSCFQKAQREGWTGDQAKTAGKALLNASLNAFRQASTLNPKLPWTWAGMGRVYLVQGRLKDAEQAILKSVTLAPSAAPTQIAKAELLLAQHKPAAALQVLYKIKTLTSTEPEVYLLSARASLALGRTDDAVINLKQLLSLKPDHTDGLKLLSRAYELKMKPENASSTLETAVLLNPSDVKSVMDLLKIYDQQSDTDSGYLLLRSMLKRSPKQMEYIHALLAQDVKGRRWADAYQDGVTYLGPLLTSDQPTTDALMATTALFARATHHKAKGLLDREAFFKDPVVQAAYKRLTEHNESLTSSLALVTTSETSAADQKPVTLSNTLLQDRLALLYLDPLTELPVLPESSLITDADLPVALKIAFLSGNHSAHAEILNRLVKLPNDSTVLSVDVFTLSRHLADLGDFEAAEALLNKKLDSNADPELAALHQNLKEREAEIPMNRLSIERLSHKTSLYYWEKHISLDLQANTADWQTHQLLADLLRKKDQPRIAGHHEKLAKLYKPLPKSKHRGLHFWPFKRAKYSQA